jgi:hypothetical protein
MVEFRVMVNALKEGVKSAVTKAFPGLALRFFSIRSRQMREALTKQCKLDDMARSISRATGGKVVQGPFAGMRLDYEAMPVHAAPKFLGTYEREIHSAVERAIALEPSYILNVGCAEGFYSVGLAMRLPKAHVFAADADPKALRATMRNAALNGVQDRVSSVGIVKPGRLNTHLRANGSLLVMDCEGAEFALLDPAKDPILIQSQIIVEIHPEFGSMSDIVARFEKTHRIEQIDQSLRSLADMPLRLEAGLDLLEASDERRGEQSWLYLEVK